MKEQPKKETHYGKEVWVNPTTESLRKTECLCLNCGNLKPGQPDNCPTAQSLYEASVKNNLALAVTRCPIWKTQNQCDHKARPLLPWNSETTDYPANLVWRAQLDNRFIAEVHRIEDNKGKLCLFDHMENDTEIACWEVNLSYGARFGPDIADVEEWAKKVEDFIDNTYSKQP